MNVLVINAGSSSFKYQLIDMSTQHVLCGGLVERIGDAMGRMVHKIAPDSEKEEKIVTERPFSNHVEGMKAVVAAITDPAKGVIKSTSEVHAIGHRVVMGGEAIKDSVLVDAKIKDIIRNCFPLSPLHNPANLAGIEVAEELFPGVPNVGVFDTEFHQSMPEAAYLYPLPFSVYEDFRVRRYGFHGTSHRYVTRQAAKFLGKPLDQLNIITCHLGNGCSMTAVRNGKSVDTTMGTTPLDGLMMGTRCGEIDPAIVPFLMEKTGKSAPDIDKMMNKESGLKGICGLNDMRDIHSACEKGDAKAILALEMFVYRIKKYVGAYAAVLGRVDALVFTAGIGENDDIVRKQVCSGLDLFGIALDLTENAKRSAKPRSISPAGTRVPVLVIPTNEELEIATITVNLVDKK
ncbi:MAG: acetate kinase [Bilophila sp.]